MIKLVMCRTQSRVICVSVVGLVTDVCETWSTLRIMLQLGVFRGISLGYEERCCQPSLCAVLLLDVGTI